VAEGDADAAALGEPVPDHVCDADSVAVSVGVAATLVDAVGEGEADAGTEAEAEVDGETEGDGVMLSDPKRMVAAGASPAVALPCVHVLPSEQLKAERTVASVVAPGAYTCAYSVLMSDVPQAPEKSTHVAV